MSDAAREQLGDGAYNAARDEGRAMSFEEVVAYALEGEGQSPAWSALHWERAGRSGSWVFRS